MMRSALSVAPNLARQAAQRGRGTLTPLTYSFARIGAALKMKVEDLRPRGASWQLAASFRATGITAYLGNGGAPPARTTTYPGRHNPSGEPVNYRRPTSRTLLLLGVAAIGTTAVLAACTRSMPVGNASVPEPAKPVEFDRYLGVWYEIARYDNGFERGCEAVTAEYSLRPDGLIRVLNTCREGSPAGRARSSEGKAKIVPGSRNAKLKVSFFGPFFVGDYWVLDHADDYAWSIVGEPRGKYLWILSRDPTLSGETLDMLIGRVRHLGYDAGLLRMTRQPPG